MPSRLILLRHGRSEWNDLNLFTGWWDSGLSARGIAEAHRSGELLRDEPLLPDVVHTSVLVRAIDTAERALQGCGRSWVPVRRSWRLNERHYGALQGKDKAATVAEFGAERVQVWRRSYEVAPEPIERGSPFDVFDDPRYRHLPPDQNPLAECLRDCLVRVLPYWTDEIVPDLRAGHVTLVAAHGNSLRALVKHLDGIADDDIAALNIPTGNPLVYDLDDDLRPVPHPDAAAPLSGRYLDPDAATAGAAEVAAQTGGNPAG
ncbi:MAG: 2,3-bisphosphoglycerate-dependent phosphoglycerate mutase [Acidimicrobiales bacterium]